MINITGLVSTLDSPTALIGIYDPYGMLAGFYFGAINSDLEFSTSFLVKDGVNFRTEGTYSIKAHYAESEAISFFEYHKESHSVIDETIDETIDASNPIDESTIKETFQKSESKSENNSIIKKLLKIILKNQKLLRLKQ